MPPPLLYLLIPDECLQLACVNISKSIFVCDAKAADKVKNTNVPPPHSRSAQNSPPSVVLALRVHVLGGCRRFHSGLYFTLTTARAVDGLHDSGQAAAQVVGLVDVHCGGVFEHDGLPCTVQDPGKQLPPTSPAMSLQTEEEFSENEKQPECRFQGSSSSLPFDIRPKSSKLQKQSTIWS